MFIFSGQDGDKYTIKELLSNVIGILRAIKSIPRIDSDLDEALHHLEEFQHREDKRNISSQAMGSSSTSQQDLIDYLEIIEKIKAEDNTWEVDRL